MNIPDAQLQRILRNGERGTDGKHRGAGPRTKATVSGGVRLRPWPLSDGL